MLDKLYSDQARPTQSAETGASAQTKLKLLALSCGLLTSVALTGCSGGGDAPASATPLPSVSTTPPATATPAVPSPTATPGPEAGTPNPQISPLGGKPATEEEKEYYRLQTRAKDFVLARDYEKAIPLLEQAAKQRPNDVENAFYLLLSHGSLEVIPSKGSAAYPYAKKVVELAPNTNEASRARSYLVGAELSIPKGFKYGDQTFHSLGEFQFEPETAYKLVADTPLHTELAARISPDGQKTLWETEVAPKMSGGTVLLKKGTEVQILSESHYFHSLTSWRKPLPKEPTEYDDSIFEVHGFYVEVVSAGDNKGKKGWIINQVDRFIDKPGDDPFGVWISNRLGLARGDNQ